ncbi:toprim domain-containing protein, partial [Planotetraspora phitsanulokensis]
KDPDGTTVAFIGRSRDGDPKYLNSPHTPIYAKGQTLFGLHAITTHSTPVITEGPLDAMAVTLAGQGCLTGLALCGTALTLDQVKVLGAATDLSNSGVLVAFDNDRAGQDAAVRSYALFKNVCAADALMLPPRLGSGDGSPRCRTCTPLSTPAGKGPPAGRSGDRRRHRPLATVPAVRRRTPRGSPLGWKGDRRDGTS